MRAPLAGLLLALALAACGAGESTGPVAQRPAPPVASLAGSPPELASLHRQAGRLLDGGPGAFRRRLASLEGHPVVVNKWASWCPPCRAEFQHFERQALKRGREVAFIGVNSMDSDGAAREFLAGTSVPYPSYTDPDGEIARVFKGAATFPATAFYDSRGAFVTVKQGSYATEGALAADIERYAR